MPVVSALAMPGLSGGKAWLCWEPDWALGGIVPPGEARGSGGGFMRWICDVLREAGVEFWRESDAEAGWVLDGLLVIVGRGDGGMELRSGAMA